MTMHGNAMRGLAASVNEHAAAGVPYPDSVLAGATRLGATLGTLLEARDHLAPTVPVPHGLAAALTRLADAHAALVDILPTRPPLAAERLTVRAVLDEASDSLGFPYGCEGCTCGTHGTPAPDCRVHWATAALEAAGLYT